MHGKITVLVLLLFGLLSLQAQQRNNRSLGIESGFLLSPSDAEGLGLLFAIEPKLEVAKKIFAGARFSFALNTNTFENYLTAQYEFDTFFDNAVVSFTPTVDYYPGDFAWNGRSCSPYLGVGLGYYLLYGTEVRRIGTLENIEVDVSNRLGGLLRAGLELRRLRLGIEYIFLPKADLEVPDGQIVGTVDNRYLGLSIGYIVGIRKDVR